MFKGPSVIWVGIIQGDPRWIRQIMRIDDEGSAGPRLSGVRQEEQEKSSKQP